MRTETETDGPTGRLDEVKGRSSQICEGVRAERLTDARV